MRRGHLGQQPKPHEKLVSSKGDATAWRETDHHVYGADDCAAEKIVPFADRLCR